MQQNTQCKQDFVKCQRIINKIIILRRLGKPQKSNGDPLLRPAPGVDKHSSRQYTPKSEPREAPL